MKGILSLATNQLAMHIIQCTLIVQATKDQNICNTIHFSYAFQDTAKSVKTSLLFCIYVIDIIYYSCVKIKCRIN